MDIKLAQALEDNAKLQKENEELKAQIEKMKCCGNCDNWNSNRKDNNGYYCIAHDGDNKCPLWELKEIAE